MGWVMVTVMVRALFLDGFGIRHSSRCPLWLWLWLNLRDGMGWKIVGGSAGRAVGLVGWDGRGREGRRWGAPEMWWMDGWMDGMDDVVGKDGKRKGNRVQRRIREEGRRIGTV